MESLNDTTWDVVIAGTGLPQALLALALSRSGKKILHVDRNEYYGGDEAALSLAEAETWAQRHAAVDAEPGESSLSFSHAKVRRPESDDAPRSVALKASRAYSLALAPHLLYCRSSLLSTLVSSQTHSQLDFQAVGSWFILNPLQDDTSVTQARLTRVPGGREDIFQDKALDLKSKRSLMKFLRFVSKYEEQPDAWHAERSMPFTSFLEQKYGLSPAYHAPIVALAMSARSAEETLVDFALPRIYRHLSSIGLFGPGFAAVLPKWGGLAEIAQVACRAGAVGGGVYVLGKGISSVQVNENGDLKLCLSGGEEVTSKWLAGTVSETPSRPSRSESETIISRSISIISSPLISLFPSSSEGGVNPVAAVVMVPAASNDEPPVHIYVHSSDSGECPSKQSILYAYIASDCRSGFARLDQAITSLLDGVGEQSSPHVLWSMQYQQRFWTTPASQQDSRIITLRSLPSDPAFDDNVLGDIKSAWCRISQTTELDSFMKFEAREGTADDDDNDGV